MPLLTTLLDNQEMQDVWRNSSLSSLFSSCQDSLLQAHCRKPHFLTCDSSPSVFYVLPQSAPSFSLFVQQGCDISPLNSSPSFLRLPMRILSGSFSSSYCRGSCRRLFFTSAFVVPGLIPAHEDRWSSVGNLSLSVPISARIDAAPCSFIPGIVCNNSYSFRCLSSFISISPSIPTTSFSIDFMCSNEAFIINTWWFVTLPTNASLRASFFFLSLPRARQIISSGVNSPLRSASIISFPLTPILTISRQIPKLPHVTLRNKATFD